MIRSYKSKILFKKAILNYLLNYLSPTNVLIVYLSQDLDNLISKYQRHLYKKYKNKNTGKYIIKKVA